MWCCGCFSLGRGGSFADIRKHEWCLVPIIIDHHVEHHIHYLSRSASLSWCTGVNDINDFVTPEVNCISGTWGGSGNTINQPHEQANSQCGMSFIQTGRGKFILICIHRSRPVLCDPRLPPPPCNSLRLPRPCPTATTRLLIYTDDPNYGPDRPTCKYIVNMPLL